MISVTSDSAKITVAQNASVKKLTMDGKKATVVVDKGSKVKDLVVAEKKRNCRS